MPLPRNLATRGMLFAPGSASRESPHEPRSRDGATLTNEAQPRGDPRILVVDDDALTRHVVARRLRQWGYEALAFEQAGEVLRFLETATPRALVTDMHMPETDGLALARAVHSAQPHLPIVLMTGDADPSLRQRAHAQGIGEVVLKSTDRHEALRAALGRALTPTPSIQPVGDVELAHSLRTPLTALKSAIDLLCRGELPESQRRFAGIAQRNVDQMILVVERLLERAAVRH